MTNNLKNNSTIELEEMKDVLINKKVVLEIIKRKPTSLYKDADEATMLTGSTKSFGVPVDQYNNIVNPLTKDEQLYLENLLGIDLNIYTKNSKDGERKNFWTTKQAKIIFSKKQKNVTSCSIILDLSKPYEFILYKIALVNPRIAKNWKERLEDPIYEAVIKDGDAEFLEQKHAIDVEDTVIEYLFKNKTSKKKLFDLIRLYGQEYFTRDIKYTNSAEFLYTQLRDFARDKTKLQKLYTIISLGEKDLADRTMLADAVTAGLIEKQGWEYRLIGGEKLGGTDLESIDWLNTPANQNVKLQLIQKIDTWYKNNR